MKIFIIFVVGLVGFDHPMKAEAMTVAPTFSSHYIIIAKMQDQEVWKRIPKYPLYEVSNLGNVRNSEKTLNSWLHSGYLVTKLYNKKGERIRVYIHRMLAEAFIPKPIDKTEVNHINGIKSDCFLENLEWVTRSENISHAYSIGLNSSKGSDNGNSKFTEKDIIEIRNIDYTKYKQRYIAEKYGISFQYLNKIIKRKVWAHV